jgi:hypothetical protein
VSDLTIHEPQSASFGFTGLLTDNTARRIAVTEDTAQTESFRIGVYLDHGAVLEDSQVALKSLGTVGVFVGDGHVRRSALLAETAATTNNGSIEQSLVTGFYAGVRAYGGATSITSSRIAAGEDFGLSAESYAGVPETTIDAVNVTIVGAGVGYGAMASTDFDSGVSAAIRLTNAVIRGFPSALHASAPGAGHAAVAASYSDYDPSGNGTSGGANAAITATNVSNVGDAGFADPAGGDYHLLPGSPLVDAGAPATAQGLDLDGKALVADGDRDGTPRRDLGAFELQPPAIPGGSVPPAGGGKDGDTPAPDTVAPLVFNFRAAPALFTVARAATPLAARLARGTRFRFALSEAARVTLKIQRVRAGRRSGGRCVRPTPRLRHAARCKRHRTLGALARSAQSGTNSIRFSGRLGERALRRGRYRAQLRATDAAGNRSAPQGARFRIVRR